MSKTIMFEDDAKSKIIKGIDSVADIVKKTVGPKGRNILIRNQISQPIITNDGVTIAKSIELKDTAEDAGAQLIISAAKKTNDVAGDGTTTTTILSQEMIHLFNERIKDFDPRDINVVKIQNDMIEAGNQISDYILKLAKPVFDFAELRKVATISSGSETTGEFISNAFEMAGEYGSVIVEDSKTGNNELESIQGMKIENGSISPYLFNDRVKQESFILDADLLIIKDKLDSPIDLIGMLDTIIKEQRKLIILCDDASIEVLNMIIMNKAKGAPLNISIIRLPGYGDLRNDLIEDLCLATGATAMGRENGLSIKEFKTEYLGILDEAQIKSNSTVFKFAKTHPDGRDLSSSRLKRVEDLMLTLNNEKNSENTKQLERRIANLTNGISILKVGGNSDVEIKDKKLRIEDAINSVLSAKEEGIVPGGGFSFLSALIDRPEESKKMNSIGANIVYDALKSVTRQIAENAGENGDFIVDSCIQNKLGYNALTDHIEDLYNKGIINSAKVDRYSILNAVSLASTVITMGGLIVEENEKDTNVLQLQGPLGI